MWDNVYYRQGNLVDLEKQTEGGYTFTDRVFRPRPSFLLPCNETHCWDEILHPWFITSHQHRRQKSRMKRVVLWRWYFCSTPLCLVQSNKKCVHGFNVGRNILTADPFFLSDVENHRDRSLIGDVIHRTLTLLFMTTRQERNPYPTLGGVPEYKNRRRWTSPQREGNENFSTSFLTQH